MLVGEIGRTDDEGLGKVERLEEKTQEGLPTEGRHGGRRNTKTLVEI